MQNKLFSYLDAQRDTVIDLQSNMTAIPALGPENGGIGEIDKAAWLEQYLRAHGITDIQEFRCPDDRVPCGYRPTLSAVIKGENSARTLWVIGHTDIVPAGDLNLWNSDPFTVQVDGDTLIGRGVEDDQQAIVSGILAARAFIENGVRPAINLGLLLVADEETSSTHGLGYILEAHPELIKQDDLVLVMDAGNPEGSMAEVTEKGIMWLKVTVNGKQCHASTPEQGVNSLMAAAAMIVRVPELNAQFPARDELFLPPVSTFTPTKKEANVPNVNTVPGTDIFHIDCRVLPCYKVAEVREAAAKIAREIEAQYGVTIDFDTTQCEDAATPTPVDTPLMGLLRAAVQEVNHVEIVPQGMGGGTVAALLRRKDIPSIVWSTLLENPHVPNEKSLISNAIGDAKVLVHIAMNNEASK